MEPWERQEEQTSTQSLSVVSEKRPNPYLNKFVLAGFGILILIAIGAFYFLVIKRPEKEVEVAGPRETVSLPISQGTGTYYTGSQGIVLLDLTQTNLSGTAYRSVMSGHIFWAAHITASDPPEGKFYQMWVIQNEIIHYPAGILSKDWNGYYSSVYGFTFNTLDPFFSTLEDLPNDIAITLETVDDTTMEQKIMEGKFTR